MRSLAVAFGIAGGAVACSSQTDPPGGAGGGGNSNASAGANTAGAGTGSGGVPAASGSGSGVAGGGVGGLATGGSAGSAGSSGSATAGGGGSAGASGGSAGGGGAGGTGGGGGGGAGGGTGGSAGGGTSSPGCGTVAPARPNPQTQQTLMVGGVTRYYLIYVPENYESSKPLSLVFGIHGLNMNNVWAAHDASGFQLTQATNNQAVLVYPQGLPANGQSQPPSTQSQWGTADSNWGGPPPSANPQRMMGDLAFFDAMLEKVQSTYCIDKKRIFAVGFSQGGFMTNTLGCERAAVFKGLAPVAGWGPNASAPTCSSATASQPLLQTQGTADTTVTPALGEATRDFWRGRNGCQSASQASATYGQGCVEYQGCAAGKPVVYCTHGGGHSVPSGAGARAWKFFESLN